MADAPRGMGRGLAAILPTSPRADGDALRKIPVDRIGTNPRQPRRHFDERALIGLAESIEARGILQPLVIRELPDGAYELIAGERRLRAARIAGLAEVPALVRAADDADRLELALLENVAREDLNPVEEARACATLVDDLGVTKEELARRLGKSRAAVSNLTRILRLPEPVLEQIERGELSEGHGRALLLCGDHETRRRLGAAAAAKGWSVRETERRARDAEGVTAIPLRRGRGAVPADLAEALAAASDVLTAALGYEVKVKPAAEGRCRAEIEFERPGEAVELGERLLRRAAA